MARRLSGPGLAAGLLFAGCGADPMLDPASVESGLSEALFPQAPSIVEELACPDPDVELIAQSLVCRATLHGEPISIDVTIREDGAAEGVVRERLLDLATVERGLADRVADDIGVEPQVVCPGSFVVDRPGVGFECTATHDGESLTFVGEIVDEESSWSVTLVS